MGKVMAENPHPPCEGPSPDPAFASFGCMCGETCPDCGRLNCEDHAIWQDGFEKALWLMARQHERYMRSPGDHVPPDTLFVDRLLGLRAPFEDKDG